MLRIVKFLPVLAERAGAWAIGWPRAARAMFQYCQPLKTLQRMVDSIGGPWMERYRATILPDEYSGGTVSITL